ncbi:MAG: hypothetical protein RIC12_00110 [Pirellulales bacterium]
MSNQPENNTTNSTKSTINLRERFGQDYRIGHEESYHIDRENCTEADEVALQIMPCKYGHIFPWDSDHLAASTAKRGKIANRLRSLDCCKVEQDGDDGVNVSFRLADFDVVAEVMQPRRRRKLSPERRKAFIEAGRAQQFTKSTGQTTVFRGQDTSRGSKTTSEPSRGLGAKIGPKKMI